MALVLDLPPKLILPDYYQASRPAIIRPEGSFSRIGLPIEASLPGIAALVWGGNSEAAPGQQVFTATSTSWVVPDGVTSISALCVGHGGFGESSDAGGRGGDLRYAITLAVTPGETLTIGVPGYSGNTSTPVSIKRGGTTLLAAACGRNGSSTAGTSSSIGGNIGGGNGGTGFTATYGTGGGAGGYSGNGGAGGGGGGAAGGNGAGGGGGGGRINGGGGGVGLLGQGSNGAGATSGAGGGGGGSGGAAGGTNTGASGAGAGGSYGGGSGVNTFGGATPGAGAVRIIWGAGRAYPSTNTGDV